MSATDTTGTWVKNRDVPGATLYNLEGTVRYEVTVEGAQLPIPVVAKNITQVREVLAAHGLKFVGAKRTGEVLPMSKDADVIAPEKAKTMYLPGGNEKAARSKVKRQIAEQAAAPVDEIDSLLDSAAPAVGENIEKITMKVDKAAVDKAVSRQAKPDPKPTGKGKARQKPATSAEKAAARKGGTMAGKRKAAAEKPVQAAKPATEKTNPRSERAKADADKAVALWKDAKFAPSTKGDARARRKAIAEQLPQLRGRVRGILVAAGISQPAGRS